MPLNGEPVKRLVSEAPAQINPAPQSTDSSRIDTSENPTNLIQPAKTTKYTGKVQNV